MVAVRKVHDATERFDAAVPLSLIDDNPRNPRRSVGDVAELAESIKAQGILQALLVTPRGKRYLLVAGHRRKAGAKVAGRATVPCVIREMSDEQVLKAMLVENCQREDLSMSEEARAYQALAELGLSQREIAGEVGKSQGHISKRMGLLVLPDVALERVDSGGITLEDAAELAKLKDHPKEIEKIAKNGGSGVRWKVQEALRTIEDRKKADKIRARCKREGIPVIKSKGDAFYFLPPDDVFVLGKSWGELPVDKSEHAKLPCHAVGISGGKEIPCCTNRAAHPEVKMLGDADREERTARDDARRAEKVALEAASERRRVALEQLVEEEDQARLVAAALISDLPIEICVAAGELLDIEVVPVPDDLLQQHWTPRAREAMATTRASLLAGAKSKAAAQKLVLAVVLLEHEAEVARGDWTRAAPYFDALRTIGYQPAEVELARLTNPSDDNDLDFDDFEDDGDADLEDDGGA